MSAPSVSGRIPRVALTPEYSISRIVKGGWQLSRGHGNRSDDAVLDTMQRFVDAGVTTFDCADIYTGVESLIGTFIARLRAERGSEAACGVQVHTKFVPDLDRLPTMSRKEVEEIINRSLRRLSVERLDLVQFHWWDYSVPRYTEVASWLADLVREGKIRHLGATNFDTARMKEMCDAGIPFLAHQVQYSVVDRRPAVEHAAYCAGHDIRLLCYGSVAGGFLARPYLGRPVPAPPYENRSLTKYALVIEDWGGWDLFQELLRVLDAIGEEHHAEPEAVAIAWVLRQPAVAAAIVGAHKPAHLDVVIRAAALALSGEDCERIAAIQALSQPLGEIYALERDRRGRHGSIMRYDLNAQAVEG